MPETPDPGSAPQAAKGYQSESGTWWASLDSAEKTPELVWPRNIEVFDLMRRTDSQVLSVLRAVTLPIRRTKWRIDPNGARADVVQLVAEDLGLPVKGDDATKNRHLNRTRDRFDFNDYLRMALTKLYFGHAFFEQVYRIENVQGAQRARLRKLLWLPPRTISEVAVAADGGLKYIRQQQMKQGVKIDVDGLVAHVSDREGGNWLGQSLLRPAYKFWVLKDRMLRVQAQTIDRNGMGVPVYTDKDHAGPGVDAEEQQRREKNGIAAGARLARSFRSGDTAGASLPNGASLTLKGVDGKLPDAMPAIRYYDDQIARAVLAHFLNLGGDDSTGSYALGDTFADFFTLSLQTVAMEIATTTNQHVIEDLVDLNFGPDAKAPLLEFDEIGSRHPVTGEAIRALVECGALTPDGPLEAYLRTTFGLPALDPESAAERRAAATPPAAPAPAPADPAPDPDDTEQGVDG